MARKNDYTVIVFGIDFLPYKMVYVHNLYKLSLWLQTSKFHNWHYMNVYNRRTGQYLTRFYKGNYIAPYPTL